METVTDNTTKSSGDPNSVQDYAVSKGLVKDWTPQNAAALFEKQGLGTAASYLAKGKNNSAENTALLAKLKGYGGTTVPGTISGSASVNQKIQNTGATHTAVKSVVPDQTHPDLKLPPPPPAPTGVINTKVNPDGSHTYMLANGQTINAPIDPMVVSAQNNLQIQFDTQSKVLSEEALQQVGQLQTEKAKALNAASAFINTAQSGMLGTERTGYLANIEKMYDDQILRVQASLADNQMQLKTNLTTSLDSLNAQVQSNASANFSTFLSSIKSGDGSPLNETEMGSILGTAIQAGIDPNIAVKEIDANLAQARINASVKLSTQERQDATQALQDYKTITSGITDMPEGEFLTGIASKGIEAHMFKADDGSYDPKGGTSKAESQVLKQVSGEIAKADLAQRSADRADRSAARSEALLGATLERLDLQQRSADRADRNSAVSNINTAVDNFTKAGTPGQQLNNASSYMSSIEAAHDSGGKGVSALTLIDALVKLDTGGQAVRQGQTDILDESGTWGDTAKKFMAKVGLSSKAGANTVLSPNQVEQIYSIAKNIAKEKIISGQQQYSDLKRAVDETKTTYPGTDAIVDATANLGNIDTFIQKYGADVVPSSSGSSAVPASDPLSFIKSLPGYVSK